MKNRILFIDYARSIALFLVVFSHLYSVDSNVRLYIYAFHMPFFFLMSGMFHKEADFLSLIKKMSKRMLIPFCFFILCGYLYFVVSSHSLAKGVLLESVKGVVFGKSIKANDILWFLLVMFNVRIIGNSIIKYPMAFLPVLFFAFIITFMYNINFFYLGTTLMALPFYLFGDSTKEIIFKFIQWKYSPIIAILLFALSVIISNLNGRVSMAGFVYGHANTPFLCIVFFYANGILGSLALLSLGSVLERNNVAFTLSSLTAKCAISIVGLQFIPLTIWHKLMGLNQNYILCAAYSIFIMVGSICFHLLIEKKANWILGGK